MRPSRNELLFVALGAVLGAAVAYAVKAGLVAPDGALPPFAIVLIGLGLVELAAGFATGRSPGTLVGMPARFLAFVVGVCIVLLGGKFA
jgi:multisubunit Na+/H+ antiporter MnhB subunit